MHFIIRGPKNKLPSDPYVRKRAVEAWEKAQSLPLREAAKARRERIKQLRFDKLSFEWGPTEVRKRLCEATMEESKAIRRNMEHRIND